jgi:glycosyltransferase involved in cell wall biosynthesis
MANQGKLEAIKPDAGQAALSLRSYQAVLCRSNLQTAGLKTKVLIAAHREIADCVHQMAGALREAGYAVDSYVLHPSVLYPENQYTHTIRDPWWGPVLSRRLTIPWPGKRLMLGSWLRKWHRELRWFARFPRFAAKYDTFVFVWAPSMLPGGLDLILLKLLGKEVIYFCCGDDTRYRPLHLALDRAAFGLDWFRDDPESLEWYLRSGLRFRTAFYRFKIRELSGCKMVTLRNTATFQTKPYFLFRFPTKKLLPAPKKASEVPLIVHAPTERTVKGTKYVLAAVEMLSARKLPFRFELIEKQPNSSVLSRLLEADIVIDQPMFWMAKLAAEAMAAGCAVIGVNNPSYEGFDNDSPVIPFPLDSARLANVLEGLILDAETRQRVMTESYRYWEKYYSPQAFAAYFEDVLAGRAKCFHPLPNQKQLLVKHCNSWMQKFVISLLY